MFFSRARKTFAKQKIETSQFLITPFPMLMLEDPNMFSKEAQPTKSKQKKKLLRLVYQG